MRSKARKSSAALALLACGACAGPAKMTFEDLSSTVQLASLPEGAEVQSNGQRIGVTPTELQLEPGRQYQLTFALRGFAPQTVSGTRADFMHAGGGQVGVVLIPEGLTLSRAPSMDKSAALEAIAMELAKRKDWGHTAELWARVLALQPRNPRAHRGLGSAYAKLGRDEDAIREYEQYLFLAPDEEDAPRVRKAVDAFRGGIVLPGAEQ